jgi:hypothetical protein
MELSYKPETRGPVVQGSAGLKWIWKVSIQAADGALIQARYGSAGLKIIWEARIHAADGALIQSRHPETCSTKQCRVKKNMGSEHSERRWSSHTNQRPGVLQYKAVQG